MTPPLRRALITAVCVVVAALAASLASGPAVRGALTSAPASTVFGAARARAADGRSLPVPRRPRATPVHPEALTHPWADFMGSTLAAHEPRAAGPGRRPAGTVSPGPISPDTAVPKPPGIDVSSNQGPIDWAGIAPKLDFVYAKATEGTYYRNPDFAAQYNGPYDAGLIRGAYHFAIPSNSSGAAQADFFVAHGGGWSDDGMTLPGALDIEYNPYGKQSCYGLSQSAMTDWLWSFVDEYAAREHVYPVIYSTTDWWSRCTGDALGFGEYDPFWVADYSAAGSGPLPQAWPYYSFRQYSDDGALPGDQDVFNGALSQLKLLATQG